jgi:hypothetical protein
LLSALFALGRRALGIRRAGPRDAAAIAGVALAPGFL